MPKYIDADALKHEVATDGIWSDLDPSKALRILDLIDVQPAADVVSVVYGWWIEDGGARGYLCSVCGDGARGIRPSRTNFCPDCGAMMNKENDR